MKENKRVEEFKEIKGYDGYFINLAGVVISRKRKTQITIKLSADKDGYMKAQLWAKNKQMRVGRYRMLMLAFRYKQGCERLHVDHINGDRVDDRLENLRWCTQLENLRYTRDAGRGPIGTRSGSAKIKSHDVVWIRNTCIPNDKMFGFSALASILGVCRTTIARAYKGGTWNHVK